MGKLPDEVHYREVEGLLKETVYERLVSGLVSNNKNKLESHIIEICEPYDSQKSGIVHMNDLITALRISEKLLLSKIQVGIELIYKLIALYNSKLYECGWEWICGVQDSGKTLIVDNKEVLQCRFAELEGETTEHPLLRGK